jgi:ABC-2 type transport system ATP-binding protein
MSTVEVSHISKSFGDTKAVQDVTFTVLPGEIFGMLGPNGAGKTTTIRIMLDIFKPDQGEVSIFGGDMSEAKKERIGYMPEERGLYQEITLEKCLIYLASLKGLSKAKTVKHLEHLLKRFDLVDHKNKKVKELSKGMQQKAQIINTILHKPKLVVIDEPFTALDPINAQLVKDVLRELRDQGTTIIMSTHQMHQVEELCDRILLINEGRDVLYGDIDEIRRSFAGNAVLVRTTGQVPEIRGVDQSITNNGSVKLVLAEGTSPQDVLHRLTEIDVELERFEVAVPSLDEIFIQIVNEADSQ